LGCHETAPDKPMSLAGSSPLSADDHLGRKSDVKVPKARTRSTFERAVFGGAAALTYSGRLWIGQFCRRSAVVPARRPSNARSACQPGPIKNWSRSAAIRRWPDKAELSQRVKDDGRSDAALRRRRSHPRGCCSTQTNKYLNDTSRNCEMSTVDNPEPKAAPQGLWRTMRQRPLAGRSP
jgi:hypothetical protein